MHDRCQQAQNHFASVSVKQVRKSGNARPSLSLWLRINRFQRRISGSRLRWNNQATNGGIGRDQDQMVQTICAYHCPNDLLCFCTCLFRQMGTLNKNVILPWQISLGLGLVGLRMEVE